MHHAAKFVFLSLVTASNVLADFRFGASEGEYNYGEGTYVKEYHEYIQIQGTDICVADQFWASNSEGKWRGVQPDWLNWCDVDIKIDGTNLVLDDKDPVSICETWLVLTSTRKLT